MNFTRSWIRQKQSKPIIRDEFSNCCLRISPTPDHNQLRPKIIICKDSDLLKLNYLDDQILKTDSKNQTFGIESIVDVLKKENITGHVTENREIIACVIG